jgi:hypothetical protein
VVRPNLSTFHGKLESADLTLLCAQERAERIASRLPVFEFSYFRFFVIRILWKTTED